MAPRSSTSSERATRPRRQLGYVTCKDCGDDCFMDLGEPCPKCGCCSACCACDDGYDLDELGVDQDDLWEEQHG